MPCPTSILVTSRSLLLLMTVLSCLAQFSARADETQPAQLHHESLRLMRRGYGDKLPDIPVIDHRGVKASLFSDLIKDKAVLISFFYTDCEDSCPLTNSKLAQMRKELKNSFGRSLQILSISVDAAKDTPEKVARYARMLGIESADPDMPDWKFLTGNPDDILKVRETIGLISDDFTRALDIKPSAHGTVLVVGNQATGRWTLLSSTGPMEQNLERVKRIAGWTQQVRYEDHRKAVIAAQVPASSSSGPTVQAPRPAPVAKFPLPVLGTVNSDLSGVERTGRRVNLSDLKGKVTVLSHLYTVCPHGSKAVVNAMAELNAQFGRRPDFHQVSLSAASERDTPQFFRAYADGIGVTPQSSWWFLTVDQHELGGFTSRELGLRPSVLIPEQERLNAFDLYENDLRVVLLDREGRVRGRYQIFNPDPDAGANAAELLRNDVRQLLETPEASDARSINTASIRP